MRSIKIIKCTDVKEEWYEAVNQDGCLIYDTETLETIVEVTVNIAKANGIDTIELEVDSF